MKWYDALIELFEFDWSEAHYRTLLLMQRGHARFTARHSNRNVADTCVKTGKKMGRPISFDKEAALQAAMLLFWDRDYEGTSMADLNSRQGVSARQASNMQRE